MAGKRLVRSHKLGQPGTAMMECERGEGGARATVLRRSSQTVTDSARFRRLPSSTILRAAAINDHQHHMRLTMAKGSGLKYLVSLSGYGALIKKAL